MSPDRTTYPKFNTILNVYQSFKLRKLTRVSQDTLNEQIRMNSEIQNLNYQMRYSNDLQRQMLANQIREIEHMERQRILKELIFEYSLLFSKVKDLADVNLITFFLNNFAGKDYLDNIRNYSLEVLQEFDEISDKMFANNLVKDISEELQVLKGNYNYEVSLPGKLEKAIANYDVTLKEKSDLKHEFEKKKSFSYESEFRATLKRRNTPLLIILGITLIADLITLPFAVTYLLLSNFGLIPISLTIVIVALAILFIKLLLPLIRWARVGYPEYLKSQEPLINDAQKKDVLYQKKLKEEYDEKLMKVQDKIDNHEIHRYSDQFQQKYPMFLNYVSEYNANTSHDAIIDFNKYN